MGAVEGKSSNTTHFLPVIGKDRSVHPLSAIKKRNELSYFMKSLLKSTVMKYIMHQACHDKQRPKRGVWAI